VAEDRLTLQEDAGVASSREFTNLKAILYLLASIGFFAVMFAAGRFAGDTASAVQIIFLRYLGGFLTIICVALVMKRSWTSLQSRHRAHHLIRIVGGAFGGVSIIYANAHMPIVDASAISQLSAIFLLGLGMAFLGERPTRWHLLAILACVAGAGTILASRGAFADFRPAYLLPASVALVSALLFAVENYYIKLLTRTDDILTSLAHANLLGTLILLIPAILTWRWSGPVSIIWIGLGPLAILAQYCTVRGYSLADIAVIAPMKYAALVFAAAIGWIFFAEVPTLGVVLGACLIAAGGILLARLPR
jgi:drug/metabolite transporter (DMT)-like permease